jgi:phosphoenolpyruvate phosphomutase
LSSLGRKISAGKRAQVTTDFSIIARISSLTLHPASADALLQVQAGIEAGADAMIVEGPAADGGELQEFRRLFVTLGDRVPLLALLPANSSLQEHQLADTGIRGVIYADLLLRAAYRAMLRTAEDILRSSGVWGVEASYVPLDEIRSLVAGWSDSGSRTQLNREANAG